MSKQDQKPVNHPDYQIPGAGGFLFDKWSRENKPKPRFKAGDRVVVELYVTRVYEDCDGSPLFALGHESDIDDPLYLDRDRINGFGNEALSRSRRKPR